jgi:hypothetical protein
MMGINQDMTGQTVTLLAKLSGKLAACCVF